MSRPLQTPLAPDIVRSLAAGEAVRIFGVLYTARDAAHARLVEMPVAGWPFQPAGAAIYYAGPAPAPPGKPIGSVGPTSSYRMDSYLEILLAAGALVSIGKGERGGFVRDLLKEYGGAYLVAVGGAGALLASRVQSAAVAGFPELGPEAIWRLEVSDFPALVALDASGGSIFPQAPQG